MRSGIPWGAVLLGVLILAGLTNSPVLASGERPHDVAVYKGHVVATSLGSDYVSIVPADSTLAEHVLLDAPSWGVCFAGSKAYVTMPEAEEIAILDFSSGVPTLPETASISVPLGCTEIIADKAGETLFVANVGVSPSTVDSLEWLNSVLEIEISSPTSYTTHSTERQPRALALSPDETRLFVGNVQGAFRGTGLGTEATGTGFRDPFDGGSVLVHNLSTESVAYRIPVGWTSPTFVDTSWAMICTRRDAHVRRVASGVYFARFEAGKTVQVQRMVLLR